MSFDIDKDNSIFRKAQEPVFLTPRARKGLPCCVSNYCSRTKCKGRQLVAPLSVDNVYLCSKKTCRKRQYIFFNEDVLVSFCMKNKCKMLGRKGLNYVCIKFLREIASRPVVKPPSGHTTLRLRGKAGGWTYRKV